MTINIHEMQQALIRHCVKRRDKLQRFAATLPATSDDLLIVRGKIAAFKEVLYRITRNSQPAKRIKKECEHEPA